MAVNGYDPERIVDAERPHLAAAAPLMRRASHRLGVHGAQMLRDGHGGLYGRRAVLLVGSGSNGGDALHAGAWLRSRGVAVTAVLLGSRAHEEGLAAFRAVGGRVLSARSADAAASDGCAPEGEEPDREAALEAAASADLLVDGILGTGARGGLREPARSFVADLLARRQADGRGPRVLACDVPSGLDPRTGEVHEPVLPADRTVSFIEAKSGLLAGPLAVVGELWTEGIGVAQDLVEPDVRTLCDEDFSGTWPVPGPADHKYTRGVLGTVVGSDEFPGAGLMAVRAAVNAGAGMVRFVGGDSLASAMNLVVPEAVRSREVGDGRVQAWAVGSGATGAWAEQQLQAALDSGLPVVADAAAVSLVTGRAAEGRPVGEQVLLTPHAGELAVALEWVVRLDARAAERLREAALAAGLEEDRFPESGHPSRAQIEAVPLVWATAARRVLGGTVLLKGSTTVVVGGPAEHPVRWVHRGSSPWLATAGSGDTLSGILGAALAGTAADHEQSGKQPEPGVWARAAASALLLQRRMSTLQDGPVPPTVAASRIPQAVAELLDAAAS